MPKIVLPIIFSYICIPFVLILDGIGYFVTILYGLFTGGIDTGVAAINAYIQLLTRLKKSLIIA